MAKFGFAALYSAYSVVACIDTCITARLMMLAIAAALCGLCSSFSSLAMSKRVRLVYVGFVMTIALQAAAQCDASCERVIAPTGYGFGELKQNVYYRTTQKKKKKSLVKSLYSKARACV